VLEGPRRALVTKHCVAPKSRMGDSGPPFDIHTQMQPVHIIAPASRATYEGSDMREKPSRMSRPAVVAVGTRILPPPAQIRTCSFPAYGSYLGWLTAKRWLGQGWRIRG